MDLILARDFASDFRTSAAMPSGRLVPINAALAGLRDRERAAEFAKRSDPQLKLRFSPIFAGVIACLRVQHDILRPPSMKGSERFAG
jgi:hypothetical protein